MWRQVFILLFFLIQAGLYAQYDGGYAGGRQSGMGGVAVTEGNVWSVLNNPAGMAQKENISAGIFYRNRFLTSAMSDRGASGLFPTKLGNFGFGFSYYGFDIYNEKRFVLAYGRHLWPDVRAGLSFDYLHTQLNDQTGFLSGSKGVITFQAGLQADLNEKLSMGFSVFNPFAVELSDYENEDIPAMARLGVSYQAGERFLILLAAEQHLKHRLRIKTGVQYNLSGNIFVRGGVKTNPAEYTFGLGMEFGGFVFDIATAYHLVLGASPHSSFQYDF